MPVKSRQQLERRATYVTLMGLFLSLIAALSIREKGKEFRLRRFEFVLLGLATFRAGRLAAYDQVTEPLRAPFTETKPDESGAGKTVESKGTGVQRALGDLISCPTCIGTWACAALIVGLRLIPRPTRILLAVLAATGVAELLDALAEALQWIGRRARTQAGS